MGLNADKNKFRFTQFNPGLLGDELHRNPCCIKDCRGNRKQKGSFGWICHIGGQETDQRWDSIELDVGKEGQGCSRRIDVKEKDVVCFVQFSVGCNGLCRLCRILKEKDFQFFPEDPATLVNPFSSINQPLGTFPSSFSPAPGERNECPDFEGGLTVSWIDEDEEKKKEKEQGGG
jgi:hypothetical protein